MTPFAERLVAAMQPWMTPSLELYLEAFAVMFDPVNELTEEHGTDGEPAYLAPWAKLMDPDLCPYADLPYLAQFVGVEIPKVATEAEARAIVKEEQGFSRGTTASIEVAIYKNTTLVKTSQTLLGRGIILERRNKEGAEDAYAFGIDVPTANIPSMSALEAAVNATKPGGVFPWYNTGAKYTWAEALHTYAEDTFPWNTTNIKQP
jgi:hypothetical protein